jgi:hypothetical protein
MNNRAGTEVGIELSRISTQRPIRELEKGADVLAKEQRPGR